MHKGEEVLVVATGDWQLDPVLRGKPRSADTGRISKVLAWATEHGAYLLGMGDFADALSPSNRDRWDAAQLYDSARDAMEQAAERTQDELEELTKDTRGRWLGLLSGHHYFRYADGSTTDTRLAAYLEAPHLGDMAIVHLLLPARGRKKAPLVKIWCAHGSGSGQAGSALAKIEKTGMKVTAEADAYLMGHYHKAEVTKVQRIGTIGGQHGGTPRMVSKDIALACTGSFLRGYTDGNRRGNIAAGSYVEKAMLSPSALGAVVLSFKPVVSRHGYVRIDVDASTL